MSEFQDLGKVAHCSLLRRSFIVNIYAAHLKFWNAVNQKMLVLFLFFEMRLNSRYDANMRSAVCNTDKVCVTHGKKNLHPVFFQPFVAQLININPLA